MKELKICEIKPELVSDFKTHRGCALKKAEAIVVKIKEETKEGAKSIQVVQKISEQLFNHPSSGLSQNLAPNPNFF